MNILILEDEPRNAKRLIRLLNDIDRTFIVEGPLASIKETGRILSIRQNHKPHSGGYPFD